MATTPPSLYEKQRLETLFDAACKHASAMNQRAVQASLDIGKEKTQYFEKIALACAGTIALVVSFIGAHTCHLQPSWLLRSSLITLVLGMTAAMYRNWKFPFYVFASFAEENMSAKQKKERARRDLFVGVPGTIALEDGKPIDLKEWLPQFEADDKIYDQRIAECKTQEASAFDMARRAEYAALALTIVSLAMLIVLAWENF